MTNYLGRWDGETLEITSVERSHPDRWPAHRCHRIITAAEHGEDLYVCFWHDDFLGNLAEVGEHLAAGL